MVYREIKGGSIFTQICNYNGRPDCLLTGVYSLMYPKPIGNSCGEFVQLCNAANRIAENKKLEYRAEEILTYERVGDENPYALRGNKMDVKDVYLTDFDLERHQTGMVTMKFFVNPQEAYNRGGLPQEYALKLPFLYIAMLQFAVEVEIGDVATQKMAVAFTKKGALIYELATVNNTHFNEGG